MREEGFWTCGPLLFLQFQSNNFNLQPHCSHQTCSCLFDGFLQVKRPHCVKLEVAFIIIYMMFSGSLVLCCGRHPLVLASWGGCREPVATARCRRPRGGASKAPGLVHRPSSKSSCYLSLSIPAAAGSSDSCWTASEAHFCPELRCCSAHTQTSSPVPFWNYWKLFQACQQVPVVGERASCVLHCARWCGAILNRGGCTTPRPHSPGTSRCFAF